MSRVARSLDGLGAVTVASRECKQFERGEPAIVVAVILLALCACQTATPSPIPPPATLIKVSAQETPTTSPAPLPASNKSIDSARVLTLTIWAPDFFAPGSSKGSDVIQREVDEFTRAHPETAINFAVKSPYGQGGVLDFLSKVQSLVPERLPDIAAIDSRELDAADAAGLLRPLDQDLPAGSFADLLAPAAAIASIHGSYKALPITLDVQHLAYNSQQVQQAPTTWDQLVAGTATFAFPANGDDGFLIQYVESGGQFSGIQSPSVLDVGISTAVLSFFQRVHNANLVPEAVFSFKSSQECWQAFASGQVQLAQVAAADYLADRDRVANVGFSPVPTRDGRASTMVSSWNYVIITGDPKRRAAAAQFISWMNDPERVAEWARATHMVPARRSAFALAVTQRGYSEFLLKLIEAGIAAPSFAERAPYAAGWRSATIDVLRGQATPAEAAFKAAQVGGP